MAVDHTSAPRHTSTRDHFRALGLHCEADEDEIRSAYFRLVLTNHPDRNQGDADAAARFKKIQRAYEVLSRPGPLTRTEHLLRTPFRSNSFSDPSPSCEGVTQSTFAFCDSTRRGRRGAGRVGQWLAAVTVATALVVMLRGLNRDQRPMTTSPVVGSTQFAVEALPKVNQEQIDKDRPLEVGVAPPEAPSNTTRRTHATSAKPISRASDRDVFAEKDAELPEGERYEPHDHPSVDYRRKVDSSSRHVDQRPFSIGDGDHGYGDRGHRQQGYRNHRYPNHDSSRPDYGQVSHQVNDDRLSLPAGRLRSSRQLPPHLLDEVSVGFDAAGYSSAGFDSAGFDYASFDSIGFNATGNNTSGNNATGFSSMRFHGGMPAKLSDSADAARGKFRPHARSAIAPDYEDLNIAPSASQRQPLPASFTRKSNAQPSPIRAMRTGALPTRDAQDRFSSTARVLPGSQFNREKSQWSGGLPGPDWRNRPPRESRTSQSHYESGGAVQNSHRTSPPVKGLPPFSPSHAYRPNPQQAYSTSPPNRGRFRPHGTPQPPVTGKYSRSPW